MENKLLCIPVLLPQQEPLVFPSLGVLAGYGYLYHTKEYKGSEGMLLYHHLYLVSDREIKEGDWIYDQVSDIIFTGPRSYGLEGIKKNMSVKKVEATTDKSLDLPLIPQQWIEGVFVPAQGKIDKVYITFKEHYQIPECYDEQQWREEDALTKREFLKKEVIILPVKESWSKQEVIAAMLEYASEQPNFFHNIDWEKDAADWLDKNY